MLQKRPGLTIHKRKVDSSAHHAPDLLLQRRSLRLNFEPLCPGLSCSLGHRHQATNRPHCPAQNIHMRAPTTLYHAHEPNPIPSAKLAQRPAITQQQSQQSGPNKHNKRWLNQQLSIVNALNANHKISHH